MDYRRSAFGFLNTDELEPAPAVLLDCGIERREKEFYDYDNAKRGNYKGFLLQYTLKGAGCYEKDGIQYPISKETGFLSSFPEKSRYFLPEGEDAYWEFIYFHFKGEALRPFVNKIIQKEKGVIRLSESSIPIRMALLFYRNLSDGHHLQKYEGGEFLYRLFCEVLREAEAMASDKRNGIVKEAVSIIEKEYGSLSGIEELAERVGVSFGHFSRCFTSDMGISPLQYLNQVRLQNAMNELLNTHGNLQIVARNNGFSSENYFCKVFKKRVGVTPTEYRKSRKFYA